METTSEPKPSGAQTQPICSACHEYGCQVKLPGLFVGDYRPVISLNLEKQGVLCILHYRKVGKDSLSCQLALRRKEAADDFNFQGVQFSCPVRFEREIRDANFHWATFEETDFDEANFGGNVNFRWATFRVKPRFFGAVFNGDATFERATFHGETNFCSTIFRAKANFESATFDGKVEFFGAKFRHADFFLTKFHGETSFFGANFAEDADFRQATFSQDTDFLKATFIGDANFYRVTFRRKVRFLETTFSSQAEFHIATFEGPAQFQSIA